MFKSNNDNKERQQALVQIKQLENFNIQKILLGCGKFSKVYQVDVAGQSFAVKQLSSEIGFQGYLDNILSEICILMSLQHNNIINLIGKYRNQEFYNIILEKCDGGDLNSYIKEKGRLQESLVSDIIYQITDALSYLHEQKSIIHRDIKSSNIFIQWVKNEDRGSQINSESEKNVAYQYQMRVKLGDFGFAKQLNENGKISGCFGTPIYMAPEVLQRFEYDTKADIWSLGILMYSLLTGGDYPFTGESKAQILKKIQYHSQYLIDSRLNLSDQCLDFLSHCLQYDPDNRLSASSLLQHQFLQKFKINPLNLDKNQQLKQINKGKLNLSGGLKSQANNIYSPLIKITQQNNNDICSQQTANLLNNHINYHYQGIKDDNHQNLQSMRDKIKSHDDIARMNNEIYQRIQDSPQTLQKSKTLNNNNNSTVNLHFQNLSPLINHYINQTDNNSCKTQNDNPSLQKEIGKINYIKQQSQRTDQKRRTSKSFFKTLTQQMPQIPCQEQSPNDDVLDQHSDFSNDSTVDTDIQLKVPNMNPLLSVFFQ
ncbi:UNKNOWN [Stylonychia lemnae]|uniref:Protein kinase domain-containing protein n=1 Tax=Stylonychia lemnae TaxID=5949 RepID=A0A078AI80_STYLE|nr:UNKNOWN [Stylonychia lemnae]|eukprot:CDW81970.1 UNKNOWN [Stylonychia lemnae]